jgi:hypothetical protein
MIVLFGSLGDEPLAAVVVGLADRGADLLLVDPRDEQASIGLSYAPGTDPLAGRLRCGERAVALADVSAVYVRDTGPIRDPRARAPRHALRTARQLADARRQPAHGVGEQLVQALPGASDGPLRPGRPADARHHRPRPRPGVL